MFIFLSNGMVVYIRIFNLRELLFVVHFRVKQCINIKVVNMSDLNSSYQVYLQNVPRQNIPKQNVRRQTSQLQNIPYTKGPKSTMSQTSKHPIYKTSQI